MLELSAILAHAERDQDRLAAVLRLVIAATLFIAVFAVREHGAHHHPLLVTTVTYGMVAASSAWLAWRGYHHRLLPYAFATCEAMLLAVQLVLLSSLLHLPSNLIFALPVSGFVFVLLVHASMRYRPWLVVHTAATIGVSMFVAMRVVEVVPSEPHKLMAIDQTSLLHDLVHYRAFPIGGSGKCSNRNVCPAANNGWTSSVSVATVPIARQGRGVNQSASPESW